MLDQLLGRASLKAEIEELQARIDELEDERDSLANQLAAEQERRRDAASARQDAEERVNRLEDRIAQLEGEVERRADAESGPSFRGRETIRGERTAAVLDRLASVDAGEEGALTAAVEDDVPEAVRAAFEERGALVERAAPCVAFVDDAGLVSCALRPPDPPEPSASWNDGFQVERERYLPTGEYALALVRADLFAIGEYDGRERTAFEGFETDVKGDHSKGGFSQGRFERIRDDQIEEHLAECRRAIEARSVDRLYVVGDRAAIGEFEDLARETRAVDATGKPEAALETAFREFWTTRLFLI